MQTKTSKNKSNKLNKAIDLMYYLVGSVLIFGIGNATKDSHILTGFMLAIMVGAIIYIGEFTKHDDDEDKQ